MASNLGMQQTSPNADSGEWSGQDYPPTSYGEQFHFPVCISLHAAAFVCAFYISTSSTVAGLLQVVRSRRLAQVLQGLSQAPSPFLQADPSRASSLSRKESGIMLDAKLNIITSFAIVGPDGTYTGNGSQGELKSPPGMGLNFFKQFGGVQNKVTRDGQPAKRRGPKPDSKPAQTRRQELNRQAQRTHRERKEQYIKALEIELARLRETYARDSNIFNSSIEQHKLALQEQRQENDLLRHILANHGISYETDLANRKSQMGIQSRLTPPAHTSPMSATYPYQNVTGPPASSTGYTAMESAYLNGRAGSVSGTSQGAATHNSHSPAGPDIMEQSIKREPGTVMSMPGIFEKDPQLGIDFILALEATCRDHNEYLVRRSMDSPNDPETAQISGHALMASVPPPSHISSTPAQGGGLVPTYPHQVPDVPLQSLNNLLNLAKASNQLQANGFFDGGQVTPVMALQSLRGHPYYSTLTREDIEGMIESVKNKVRCYGFGAVMEDFELRDALSSIFARHPETYEMAFGNEDIVGTDDMYS